MALANRLPSAFYEERVNQPPTSVGLSIEISDSDIHIAGWAQINADGARLQLSITSPIEKTPFGSTDITLLTPARHPLTVTTDAEGHATINVPFALSLLLIYTDQVFQLAIEV